MIQRAAVLIAGIKAQRALNDALTAALSDVIRRERAAHRESVALQAEVKVLGQAVARLEGMAVEGVRWVQ